MWLASSEVNCDFLFLVLGVSEGLLIVVLHGVDSVAFPCKRKNKLILNVSWFVIII